MHSKKIHPKRLTITFFILAVIGVIFLVITSVKLLQNDLISFSNSGEETVEITKAGEYYVLIDTKGMRYDTTVENIGVTNNIQLYDAAQTQVYKAALLVRAETDTSATTIESSEFDKQVRYKEHLSFGKIELKEGNYIFNGVIVQDHDSFGDYALLSVSYVNKIGFFSLSAMTTLLFGLLTFKYYREVQNIPLSKYQKKHIKK